MAVVLKQSTEIKVRIGPFVDATDGKTPETAVALATADEAELLKANGAATVDISGATWAAVTGADGWYDLTLTTSHTDTVGELVVVVHDDSVCLPVHRTFQVVEEAIFDALYGSGATAPATAAELAKVPKSDGSVTWNATALASINAEADTAISDYAPATATELAKVPKSDGTTTWNATALASINAEVDTAFSDYAPATATELAKVPKSDGSVTFNSTALASINAEMDTALSDYAPATAAKQLAYFQLLMRSDAAIGTDNATELTEINADGGSGAGDFSNQTEAVEALRDWIGNGSNLTEAGGTGDQLTALASQASVDTVTTLVTSTNTNVGQILTDTNEIQSDLTDGGRLDLLIDAIKTNTDSLVARIKAPLFAGMTSLANWLGAIAGKHTADATAITEINATGAGSGTYDATTDSQEAIRDRGDASWTGGGGGGDATEAKQDTIIASLGGWTGTGVNNVLGAFQAVLRKDADVTVPSDINADLGSGVGTASNITDSLQAIRDRGDSAWTPGGGVTITPLSAGDVQRSTGTTITAYEGETSAITVYAISDVDGNAVDLTTYSALEVVIEDYSGTVLQTIAHGSLGLTDAGNLTFTPSATVTGTVTTTRGGHFWSLRDTTDGDYVVAQGRMNIVRVATDA